MGYQRRKSNDWCSEGLNLIMKINISSKTVSTGIMFLVFVAIGIISVVLIGKGDDNSLSFDVYSDAIYSEHEDWADVSTSLNNSQIDNSEYVDEIENVSISIDDIVEKVNSSYSKEGTISNKQFSDEMGIKIEKISFLNDYTPENVFYYSGYVFAGDKIFDSAGNDLTEVLSGYTFVNGRDNDGNVLFQKDNKYYFLSDGTIQESKNVHNINKGPAYMSSFDKEYTLFESGGKWGAINSEGKIIVKAMFTYGFGYNEGVGCFASKAENFYFYDSDGKLISSEFVIPKNGFGAFRIQDGITLVFDGKKNLIMKASGSIIDTPSDYSVIGCSDGIILLKKNQKFGYMNAKGQWIVEPDFTNASYFSEGLAVANGSVIDRNGNIVIPKGFDYISDFSEGVCFLYSFDKGWYVAKKLI